MSRVTKAFLWVEKHPEFAIQGILATVLIATGLYLSGPWYVGGSTTAVGVVMDNAVARAGLGLAYVTSGLISWYGVAKNSTRIRYIGSFAVFLAFSFMMLLRLLAFGLTPVFW